MTTAEQIADELYGLHCDIGRLEADNAKLRKLARDWMRFYFMPSIIDRNQRAAALVKRAHELGVKEDDDELVMEVD